MRLTGEQLDELMKSYGVDRLYSWSKLNCFITSPYEYFLRYVKNEEEDLDANAYSAMGGVCHEILEDYYSDKINRGDMLKRFDESWSKNIEEDNLLFDRNDKNKNKKIGERYKNNLIDFLLHHIKLGGEIKLEEFLAAKIGNTLLQGYADAIVKENDGTYTIVDWKTSTKYSDCGLDDHSGQLVIYATALNQLGVPLEKIKCCFCFLKYCTVTYSQASGAKKSKDVERLKLAEAIATNARMWLIKYGYSDTEIEKYIADLYATNSIECLPKNVREKYSITDCFTYINLTDELVDRWHKFVEETALKIEECERIYKENGDESVFYDTDEMIDSSCYYLKNLCGYSPKKHKPLCEYLKKKNQNKGG